MGMRYFEEVLDRQTGDLVRVDQGDWITMEELSQLLGIGRRQMTTVLREMDFVQIEGAGRNSRHRICDWVLDLGWGKRNRRKADKFPFDVINPEAVQWVRRRWQEVKEKVDERTHVQPVAAAREALENFKVSRDRKGMECVQEVRWLADHFPLLTHDHIGTILHVSRQLVDRYMKERGWQLKKARELKASCREPLVPPRDVCVRG